MTAQTRTELRSKYESLAGIRPHGGWGVARLEEEIRILEAKKQAREDARAQREAEEARVKAEREARILARGSVSDFLEGRVSAFEGDDKLRWALRTALRSIDRGAEARKELAAKIAYDPIHAMSWSKSYFKVFAEAAVAGELLSFFEAGLLYPDWISHATGKALQFARSAPSSTSATSNLMDSMMMEAWAEVAQSWI
jgi:hypothetical protein